MLYRYTLILVVLFLISCTGKKERGNLRYSQEQIDSLCLDSTKELKADVSRIVSINLNPFLKEKSFDFSSHVQKVHFVPLATTDESLISDIYKIVLTDSMIYVFDDFKGGGIVIFNREGKFIRRIKHGEGPGELYRLNDISYDKENKELLAYQPPFLQFYTSTGNYLRQMRLPFGFYNFSVIPEGYMFKTFDSSGNEHLGSRRDNTLLITDKNFKLKCAGIRSSTTNICYGGYSYLYLNGAVTMITHNYNDTIYCYENETGKFEAAYVMDYHDKKIPDEQLKSYLQMNRRDFFKALSQNNNYYFIGEYLENNTHQVFFLRNDYSGLQTVVYRDKKTEKLIGGTNADVSLTEIPAVAFPKTAYGDWFISVHYPNANDHLLLKSSILTKEDKQTILNLKEDDNPILVFYQLDNY
ncbi:6-bladed beta-propeller [Bacteroides acidifaciens]|uniref:6-bladed beta-propeller n=1 Tax=Bacteroides acidifaciens TaxID=85831 RepID=UPI00242C618B|nr:6-bladed beta-propeller [Bacteroides acidifaciens]